MTEMLRKLLLLAFLLPFSVEAAISIRAMRAAVNTSTGNQDFTISGFGTVQGAIVIGTLATADDTAANHADFSIGMTDCTNHRSASHASAHGDLQNNSRTTAYDNGVLMPFDRGDVLRGSGSFSACITDGIQINWTNAPASAYLLTVILFGGADMDVAVGSFTQGNPTTTVSSLSWEPDALIGVGTSAFSEISADNLLLSVGFAANGTSTSQGAIGIVADDASDPIAITGIMEDDDWLSVTTASSTTVAGASEITAWASNGFTSTLVTGTGVPIMYMALNFNSVATAQVTPYTTPTATGAHSISGLDVDPDYVFQVMGTHASFDTGVDDAQPGAVGFGFFNSTEGFSNTISDEDNQADGDTQSRVDDRPVNLSSDAGTLIYAATLTSLDATGWTLNYATEADSAARQWIALAIGPAAAGGGSIIPQISHNRRMRH